MLLPAILFGDRITAKLWCQLIRDSTQVVVLLLSIYLICIGVKLLQFCHNFVTPLVLSCRTLVALLCSRKVRFRGKDKMKILVFTKVVQHRRTRTCVAVASRLS